MQKLRLDCSGLSPKETDRLIAALVLYLKNESSEILVELEAPISRKVVLPFLSRDTASADSWKRWLTEETDWEETNAVYEVPADQILYVTSDRHYCTFHTRQGNLRARLAFRDASNLVPQDLFLNCNRGVLLSMAYITGLSDGVFIMQDGARFSLRTKHQKEIIRQYASYRAAHG